MPTTRTDTPTGATGDTAGSETGEKFPQPDQRQPDEPFEYFDRGDTAVIDYTPDGGEFPDNSMRMDEPLSGVEEE